MVNVGGSVWLCTEISKIYTLPQIVTPLQDVDTFFEHYKSMLLNKNYKDRSALPVPIQSIHNFWHRALGFTPTVQEFTVHLQQLHDEVIRSRGGGAQGGAVNPGCDEIRKAQPRK